MNMCMPTYVCMSISNVDVKVKKILFFLLVTSYYKNLCISINNLIYVFKIYPFNRKILL